MKESPRVDLRYAGHISAISVYAPEEERKEDNENVYQSLQNNLILQIKKLHNHWRGSKYTNRSITNKSLIGNNWEAVLNQSGKTL